MSLSKIYLGGVATVGIPLFIGNVYHGLVHSNEVNEFNIGTYNYPMIMGSAIKSAVYGAMWPIFIPYVAASTAMRKEMPVKFGSMTYNYNGPISHFVPRFMV